MGLLENYSLSHYGPSSSTMVSKYRKWSFNHDQSTLTGGKRKRSRGRKDNNNMLLKSVLRHQQILHNNKYFVVGKGGDDDDQRTKNRPTTRRSPLNTPLTPVNTDALRILHANMQARDNEILQMLGNLDFRIGQAERDAEIAVAATTHQSPTTLLASPILQDGRRQLSNAGSNANSSSRSSSRTSSSPNEAQGAVIALNNQLPLIFNQSPAASSSVTTPNADSTDDAYGEANSIQTSPDSNESILSPDDDHVRDPTYNPNNGIHSPIINHRDDAAAIATRAAAAARPIPPQVLAGQFRRAAIANQLYPLQQQQQQQQPLPQPPVLAAVAAPAVGAAPAPAPRRRRPQRIRARPIPGHNFYDSHFIRALPNTTPAKRKSLLQAAIPNRKASVLKYYRENNYPIPAMMNSPNPGYAPVIPGSPADSIEDFEPPLR